MIPKQEILTYLAPSKVCKGVGVFAYVNIRKDTVIFPVTKNEDYLKIPWVDVTNRARKKIQQLTAGFDEEGFYTDVDINRFDISYYVNHSRKPNVYYDSESSSLYAMRNIKRDKELLQYYPPNERMWRSHE